MVAHNGNKFDQAKARARFLVHGFDPPSPFKEIDTLKVARSKFNFMSNRLDDLCRQLGIGRKLAHSGKHTWFGCMNGDPKAWRTMLRYNRQDVAMLEELYLKLRPWMTNHPNLALISGEPEACPNCGVAGQMQKRGKRYTAQALLYQTYCCGNCGHFCRSRISDKDTPRPSFVG